MEAEIRSKDLSAQAWSMRVIGGTGSVDHAQQTQWTGNQRLVSYWSKPQYTVEPLLNQIDLLQGGIGELLEKFNQNGRGDVAQSWISTGPNKDVSPPQLKEAIGSDVLQKLELETELSQEEILVRLSRELPSAVDKYTPEGRLPGS